jgi:hypothetical protein
MTRNMRRDPIAVAVFDSTPRTMRKKKSFPQLNDHHQKLSVLGEFIAGVMLAVVMITALVEFWS